MGTEVAIARERQKERELQILDHLEQAQSLDVPLTEYASAYGGNFPSFCRSLITRKFRSTPIGSRTPYGHL
jgi:hypothetical protein